MNVFGLAWELLFYSRTILVNKSVPRGERLNIVSAFLKLRLKKVFGFKAGNFESLAGFKVKFFDYHTISFLFREIFIQRQYDTELNKAPFIIDCGANIGVSLLFFKKKFPDAKIYCFEPDPLSYALLLENKKANNLNVSVFNKAVSGTPGEWAFFYSIREPSPKASLFHNKSCLNETTVQCVKLSSYIHGIVDLLKMDIEGAELEVLQDLQRAGKLWHIKQIIFEHHAIKGNSLAKALTILERNKFEYTVDGSIVNARRTS